jgi:hypothetical protein
MDAKQVADLITTTRALIAVFLVWLGGSQGAQGLTIAIWVMIADWIGDVVDGPISRRSRVKYHTWIGDNDLGVDMFVSCGLLIYLIRSGYVNTWVGVGYFILWGVYFWQRRCVPRSQGMLFQTPIYLWFLYIAMRDAPQAGWAIIAFIIIVVAFTWPRFPEVVIPGFLEGIRKQNGN